MTDVDVHRADTAVATPLQTRRGWQLLTLRLIGLLLLVIILYYVARDLWRDFQGHPWGELNCQPAFLALAMASLIAARLMNAMNCRHLLAALGNPLPHRRVMPVIWLASMGRYMPGKMAVVAGATMMLMRLGIRLPTAAAALFLSTALMILMGLITATPLVFASSLRQSVPSAPVFAILLLGTGLLCLYPPVFLRICNALLKWLKREPLPGRMQAGPFWTAIVLTALRSVFLGLGLWFAARALVPLSIRTYPLALASAGLASVIGFVAVFAPAGIGIHEGIYRTTMLSVVGSPIGWLVALFRILHVLADLIVAGAGLLILKYWKD